MSKERHEVLTMLAEGHITVEDAERLLDALAAGEAKRTRPEAGWLDLKIRDALEKGGRRRKTKRSRRERETVDSSGGRFVVPEGSSLVLRSNPAHPGGGSVSLRRLAGEECAVGCEGPFAVYRDEETLFIEWDYGDIEVGVPDAAVGIKAQTLGGNLAVDDLRVPLDLLTHGGDLRLSGICRSVIARSLGGNVFLEVTALDPGTESEVTTNEGDIFATLGPEFSGTVKATTLAGDVQVEDGLGRVFDHNVEGMPRATAVEVGPDFRAATITIRTLRGSLFLERGQ
jgi:hypothetical protein